MLTANEKKVMFAVLAATMTLAVVMFVLMGGALASATWWDNSWQYKSIISVTDPAALARNNETVSVDMSAISGFSRSQVLTTCNDIRVVNYTAQTEMAFTNTTCNATAVVLEFPCRAVASASNFQCAEIYWGNAAAGAPTTANSLKVAGGLDADGGARVLIDYGSMQTGITYARSALGNPYSPSYGNRVGMSVWPTHYYGSPGGNPNGGWQGFYMPEDAGMAKVATNSTRGQFSAKFNIASGAGVRNITFYDTGTAYINDTWVGVTDAAYRDINERYRTSLQAVSGLVTHYFAKYGGTFSYVARGNSLAEAKGLNYFGIYNSTTTEYIAWILVSNNTVANITATSWDTGNPTWETIEIWTGGVSVNNPSWQYLMIYGRSASASLQTNLDAEYSKAVTPLIVTAGAAETVNQAAITIESPTNTTYYTSTNLLNFTRSLVSDWGAATTPCWLTQNEATRRALGNVSITYTETLTNQSGKGNFVNVSCWDSAVLANRTAHVGWYNWHGWNLSVFSMNDTPLGNWSFSATNNTAQSFFYKSNPQLFEYKTIGRAASTTFKFYDPRDIYANITFTETINDVMGFINRTVKLYRNQEWRATSSATSLAVNTFTITFANSTLTQSNSTSNGRIRIGIHELPTGTVTLTITSNGYNTTRVTRAINTSSDWNESITLTNAELNITAWDESVQNRFVVFDAYFDNGTDTLSKTNNTAELYLLYNESLLGDVRITISNSSYIPRTYYVTMTETTAASLRAFLLSSTNPTNVFPRILVQTVSEAIIENALVSVQRFIDSAWITIAQLKTDSAGVAAFYLDSTITYRFKVEASGYITRYVTLSPITDVYRIKLSSSVESPWLNVLSNTTMWFTPESGWYNASTLPVSCFISSPSSALTLWGMNITWNGTQVYYASYTDANGGTIAFNLFTQNITTLPISATCFFRRSGYDEFNLTRTWRTYNMTAYNYTMTTAQARLVSVGPVTKTVVVLVLSMAVASVFAEMSPFVCAVVFMASVGVLMTFIGEITGVLTWATFIGAALFMLAVLLRGGGN